MQNSWLKYSIRRPTQLILTTPLNSPETVRAESNFLVQLYFAGKLLNLAVKLLPLVQNITPPDTKLTVTVSRFRYRHSILSSNYLLTVLYKAWHLCFKKSNLLLPYKPTFGSNPRKFVENTIHRINTESRSEPGLKWKSCPEILALPCV